MADPIAEIKKLLGTEKLIIGTDKIIKALKRGEMKKVFLASNCNNDTKESVAHYSGLGKVEVVDLELNNEELGDVCKKSFFISVIGVLN